MISKASRRSPSVLAAICKDSRYIGNTRRTYSHFKIRANFSRVHHFEVRNARSQKTEHSSSTSYVCAKIYFLRHLFP